MKVLFIGGTGNISTSVSRLCIEKGIDLYLLNRGTTARNIHGAKTITADITDVNRAAALLEKYQWDAVVNWIAFSPADIERDLKLFRRRTKQYIFISSASVYQKPPENPVITESTPIANPFWDYARNKIACENILIDAFRSEDFPASIVRPSHTYDTVIPVPIGGWQEYTVIDRMKKGKEVIVHGDGTSLWTVTHAEDFAKGFAGLIGNEKALGESFHITSDELLTWNQIYQYTAEAAGSVANIIHIPSDFICMLEPAKTGSLLGDKVYSVIFDNSKIKRFVPDFVASISYHEGIKRTMAWFEEDPARKVINPQTNEMMDKIIGTFKNL